MRTPYTIKLCALLIMLTGMKLLAQTGASCATAIAMPNTLHLDNVQLNNTEKWFSFIATDPNHLVKINNLVNQGYQLTGIRVYKGSCTNLVAEGNDTLFLGKLQAQLLVSTVPGVLHYVKVSAVKSSDNVDANALFSLDVNKVQCNDYFKRAICVSKPGTNKCVYMDDTARTNVYVTVCPDEPLNFSGLDCGIWPLLFWWKFQGENTALCPYDSTSLLSVQNNIC